MLLLSIMGSVVVLLVLFTFKSEPSTPKDKENYSLHNSGKVEKVQAQDEQTFCEQLKLLKGKDYWLAVVSSSLTLSLYYAFSTVLG